MPRLQHDFEDAPGASYGRGDAEDRHARLMARMMKLMMDEVGGDEFKPATESPEPEMVTARAPELRGGGSTRRLYNKGQ